MDNRTRLRDAALELFAARGYEAVGVQEIVQAAGVTKPTLYHYFGSKAGLLEAVLVDRFESLLTRLAEAGADASDLERALRRVATTCFAHAQEEPLFYRLHLALWFSAPASDSHRVAAPLQERLHATIEDLFARAGELQERPQPSTTRMAVAFLGTLHTFVGLALNGYVELSQELAESTVRQFTHGILG